MASFHQLSISFLLLFVGLFEPSLAKKKSKLNGSPEWHDGGATWYGSPTGFGSDGGACGYGPAVSKPPFNSYIAAIGPSKYKNGKGCGACYQVKCNSNPACSGNPVRVVVTDLCPGGPCVAESTHFDLSGTAFGALAKPGQENQLRNAGVLKVQWSRVKCDYHQNLNFKVDPGSNAYYLSVIIEFAEGDGDVSKVLMKDGSSNDWKAMKQLWGANWVYNAAGSPLKAPFSLMLKSRYSGQVLVANNVIPDGWNPGQVYISKTNFKKD